MLHKKRTGKAFHITKEIVEKEAMYEEVDERYQEKRIRMLQAQNMQIEEQFHRHLLVAFAARAQSSGSAASSIASRRASMTPRLSIDGGSSRKMSLDLSNLRSPYPKGMDSTSMTSPMTTGTGEGYVLSPATTYDPNTQSYVNCMDGSDGSSSAYSGMVASATTGTSSAQLPAYVTQTPGPAWDTQMTPSWIAMQQHVPTPNQTPTDSQAVHMWQQQMMQQAQIPTDSAAAMQMRQFRARLASAPELPVQHLAPQPAPAASISGPSGGYGHSRGKSQPSNNIHHLHLLTQGTHLAGMAPSGSSSPKLSAETQSTPDFCPTPNTPLSPTAMGTVQNPTHVKVDGDGVMVSHEELDPDFNEFSQFALGLGNSSLQERDFNVFDEYVALDDFGTVSC